MLSPKTDQMMAQQSGMGGGPGQEQQIFEQSFSDMAQQLLMNRLPEIASNVMTFKVIDSDIDQGSAVGAFLVQHGNSIIYIPTVLSDNQIKPLEIMYAKEYDVFLPLTPAWLDEVGRGNVAQMGEGVKVPETLYTDVDIRNLVVPPTTGRYSFASVQSDLKLPEYLDRADNATRTKFAKLMQQEPTLLKVAVAVYGSQTLVEALRLRQEKVAGSTTPTGALYVATKDTEPKEFKEMFGSEAPTAMRGVAVKGYYSKDTRKNLKRPVEEESTVKLQDIREPGAYRLYLTDGKAVTALVIPNPIEFENPFDYDLHGGPRKTNENTRKLVHRSKDVLVGAGGGDEYMPDIKYTGVLEDGRCLKLCAPIMGEPLDLSELKGKAKSALEGMRAPKAGEYGLFLRNRGGNHLEGTQAVQVESISTDSKGIKRIKVCPSFDTITLVIDPKSPRSRIVVPKGESIAMLPEDFTFVPLTEHAYENDVVCDPAQLGSVFIDKLKQAGATPVAIKEAGADTFSINGDSPTGRIAAVIKLASDYFISVDHAEEVIKKANDEGFCRVLVADVAALQKLAEDAPKKKKAPPQGQPPAGPGAGADPAAMGGMPPGAPMDPSQMGGMPPGADPSQMGGMPGMPPMAPPPPSPVEQAAAELQEEVQRQHETQMQLLQQKLQVLQAVSARAQEIEMGVPKEQSQAMAAASPDAGAAAAMPPPPPGAAPQGMGMPQPGMPPQGMAPQGMGQPQPGVPPQGMAPQGMGQPQPGMGMDPNAMPDPHMMQQAGQMNDPSMFDAAAISSLAEHSTLKELTSQYLPTLEKSVDHMGRILLILWIKGSALRGEMGEEVYTNLEDRVRNLFKGLGDAVLRLNKATMVLPDDDADSTHGLM